MIYFLLILFLSFILINSLYFEIKENKRFLVVSISILELLLVGVYFINNNKIKKVEFILSCVIVVCIMIYLGFVIFTKHSKNILSTDNEHFYLNGQKLENVYIVSNSDAKVFERTKNIIIMDKITLESHMIDNNVIDTLDKIYFLSTKPTVDSVLFEKIKDKIEYISSQNQCLIIKFREVNNENKSTQENLTHNTSETPVQDNSSETITKDVNN